MPDAEETESKPRLFWDTKMVVHFIKGDSTYQRFKHHTLDREPTLTLATLAETLSALTLREAIDMRIDEYCAAILEVFTIVDFDIEDACSYAAKHRHIEGEPDSSIREVPRTSVHYWNAVACERDHYLQHREVAKSKILAKQLEPYFGLIGRIHVLL